MPIIVHKSPIFNKGFVMIQTFATDNRRFLVRYQLLARITGWLLLDRRMKLKDLAEATGIALNNLSILKTNNARAIRFSTLDLLCKALKCQPGDLIQYVESEPAKSP